MDIAQQVKQEMEQSFAQLSNAASGVGETAALRQTVPHLRSMKELLAHVTEGYQAFLSECAGESYEWGAMKLEAQSLDTVWRTLADLHERSLRTVSTANAASAHSWIVAHNYYHAGQMVTCRLNLDPNWDADTIYGETLPPELGSLTQTT